MFPKYARMYYKLYYMQKLKKCCQSLTNKNALYMLSCRRVTTSNPSFEDWNVDHGKNNNVPCREKKKIHLTPHLDNCIHLLSVIQKRIL